MKKKGSGKLKKVLLADALLAVVLVVALLFSGMQAKEKATEQKKQAEAEAVALKEAQEKAKKEAGEKAIKEAEEAAIAAEQKEAERRAAEQAEAQRKAQEQAEAERLAAEQAEAERAAAEVTVRLTMGGDVLLSSTIDTVCATDYGYDFSSLFANVAPYLEDYDLKIINEETACGGPEFGISGYPSFNAPHEAQDAMAYAGFNCICMASNHMLDMGTGPLNSTLDYWRNAYPWMPTIGAYDSQEASDTIYYYEKEGFRIAILNYTYGSNAGSGAYYDAPYAVNMLYEDEVRQDIRIAKENSDYVIVCPHWGTEYTHQYDESQAMWAQIFLQEGVDLVLGTHPHVLQPLEQLTREDGHQMIVYYSLGNFVSNQDYAYTLVGGLADVTLRKTADGVVVDDYGIIPIATHRSWYYSAYLLKDYSNDLAYASNPVLDGPSFTWEYASDLVNSLYGDRLRNF
ncbi:MAG: CapA family protein [Lachnospiraceae bacterium]|nr:CapA family protein [Lachnospiraceae bacterium]